MWGWKGMAKGKYEAALGNGLEGSLQFSWKTAQVRVWTKRKGYTTPRGEWLPRDASGTLLARKGLWVLPYTPSSESTGKHRVRLRSKMPGVTAGAKLERGCQRQVGATQSESFGVSHGLGVFPAVLHKKQEA